LRHPLYIANWKMNKTDDESAHYVRALRDETWDESAAEIVLAPPFTSLKTVGALLEGLPVRLGAQDVHWETSGAFTGEISPAMLVALGVRYVLVGHSERRGSFFETDERVGLKTRRALGSGLIPVICVGETDMERESGRTEMVIEAQLRRALAGVAGSLRVEPVIAYEPVWAIGTGKTATPEQADEAHRFLRVVLSHVLGPEAAGRIRILYGGSVNASTVEAVASAPEVDGCLVGGASLDPAVFLELVRDGAKAAWARGFS
jgi:triosephosphate isomerase (TIM)